MINGSVISQLIAQQVSPPVTGTLVDDHVELRGLSLDVGFFNAGIYGNGFGATLTVDVNYDSSTHRLNDGFGYFAPDGGSTQTPATAVFHLQYYLSTRTGTTAFVAASPDQWEMRIVDANLSLPGWLQAALVFGAIVLPGLIYPPLWLFCVLTGLIASLELDSELANAASQAAAGVNQQLSQVTLQAQQNKPFPGTAAPQWLNTINDLSLTGDGMDASVKFAPTAYPALVLSGDPSPLGPIYFWPVYQTRPIVINLQIPPGNYRADDPSLFAEWKVVRSDTGNPLFSFNPIQQLASVDGTAAVTIDHNSTQLAACPAFTVKCTCYRLLGYRIDYIFTGQVLIQIDDLFDRHHPYVHWNHSVFFPSPNQKTPAGLPLYWARARKSAIHRTEVGARCLEMRRRGSYPTAYKQSYLYLDALPGSVEEMRRQDLLCDYCFFGGPTKTTLLP